MRSFGSFALTCAVYLGAHCAFAQALDDPPLQFDPYNKHHDHHLGHNHVYPDRGAVFRDAPKGSTIVNYAGLAYRFYNGVWFEPRGPAFIVVMPPIGVVVPTLPTFATTLKSGGETYLYANEVYYLPRPDLGGYEVVNDPGESVPPVKSAAPAGGTATGVASSALPVGTTAVATPVAPIAKTRLASLGTTGQLPAAPGVASAQATSRVPDAPQTSTASDSTSSSSTTSAAPGSSTWTVTEIRGTKTVPLTSPSATTPTTTVASEIAPSTVQGSVAFGTAHSVASQSTDVPSPTPSSPTGPSTQPVPAAAGAAAVGVAPALASDSTTAPAAGSEGPVHLASASSVAPNAVTPRPQTAYTYTSPPSASDSPSSGTLHTTAEGPSAEISPSPSSPGGIKLTAYPRNGQTADQQARDAYDCYRFGVSETGFDPMSGTVPAAGKPGQAEFDRARAACFEGRGYSLK